MYSYIVWVREYYVDEGGSESSYFQQQKGAVKMFNLKDFENIYMGRVEGELTVLAG